MFKDPICHEMKSSQFSKHFSLERETIKLKLVLQCTDKKMGSPRQRMTDVKSVNTASEVTHKKC